MGRQLFDGLRPKCERDVSVRGQRHDRDVEAHHTVHDSSDCAQTWIAKGLVYCGDAGNNDGEVFKYPAGGSAIAVFTGNFDLPLGTVAAQK